MVLVGEADGGEVSRINAAFRQRARDHLARPLPDFRGIVFHPAGPGIDLPVFFLIHGDDKTVA